MTRANAEGNLIITGIPRSGTSYACAQLNRVINTVIVNEPEEIFGILRNGSSTELGSFYAYTRGCIRNRVPILNKIVNGRYIEDTSQGDVRSYYTPEVQDDDFILGTKNTLVYLASLHKLGAQLPGATVIAFVRHPHDCIASWKKVNFPHIRNASPLFLKDYLDPAAITEFTGICLHPELASRYALLWNFLALRIMSFSDDIVLYRYEDFVTQPEHYLDRLYRRMGRELHPGAPIAASQPRRHENKLSVLELDRIHRYCAGSAARFGYTL